MPRRVLTTVGCTRICKCVHVFYMLTFTKQKGMCSKRSQTSVEFVSSVA